jgi:hypothetical protein
VKTIPLSRTVFPATALPDSTPLIRTERITEQARISAQQARGTTAENRSRPYRFMSMMLQHYDGRELRRVA